MYVCSGKLLGWVNAWVTEEFGQKLGVITACFVNCFEYSRISLLQKVGLITITVMLQLTHVL